MMCWVIFPQALNARVMIERASRRALFILGSGISIVGAGVRAFDVAQRERLKAQDCLTTLIELAPNARSAEITGSMIDYIAVEEGNAPLIEAMANPEIRIVSLTVTEGGYFTHPSTGAFDAQNDEVQHDIAHPDRPVTAFGVN